MLVFITTFLFKNCDHLFHGFNTIISLELTIMYIKLFSPCKYCLDTPNIRFQNVILESNKITIQWLYTEDPLVNETLFVFARIYQVHQKEIMLVT